MLSIASRQVKLVPWGLQCLADGIGLNHLFTQGGLALRRTNRLFCKGERPATRVIWAVTVKCNADPWYPAANPAGVAMSS